MADKLVSQDPAQPGINKVNGPTMSSTNQIPLVGLDPAGAIDGNVVVRAGGQWTAGTGGISSDTASNLGAGAQVFSSKVAGDFQFRSIIGSSGVTATQNANDITLSVTGTGSGVVIIADQKVQNTAGGTFTLGAWRTRDLNIEVADPSSLATLAANQITLVAGTYRVWAVCPSWQVSENIARLQNVTAATTLALGTSEHAGAGGASPNNSHSFIEGRFTVAAAQLLEVQHQSLGTKATDGFGRQANITTEQYTVIRFEKE